ncbi:hypothetical protein PIB30_103956, partial [Stylosanthes scabra]|nr:hypothetical protein [Stylosanthes scabra]
RWRNREEITENGRRGEEGPRRRLGGLPSPRRLLSWWRGETVAKSERERDEARERSKREKPREGGAHTAALRRRSVAGAHCRRCCFQALLRRAVLLSLPELFYSATSILCCFSATTKRSHCWINVEGEFADIIEGKPSFKNILQIKNGFSLRSSLKQGNEPRLDLDGDVLDGKVSKRFGDVVVACGSALEFPEVSVGVEDSVAKKVMEEEEEAVALGVVMEISLETLSRLAVMTSWTVQGWK